MAFIAAVFRILRIKKYFIRACARFACSTKRIEARKPVTAYNTTMEDKEELKSMITVLATLKKDGYTLDFQVSEDGLLCTLDGKECFTPDQVQIVNFYRFEGESNPDDMSILYVLESKTGAKGTISDAYGTYSDETIETFMKQVKDLGKDLDSASRR